MWCDEWGTKGSFCWPTRRQRKINKIVVFFCSEENINARLLSQSVNDF